MMNLPAVDPIPLPAPVWLFKALHNVTLSLHFGALFLLLGGLLLGIIWNVWGHWRRHGPAIDAAGVVARCLPVVMTYVINLGIPPLLFAQVLYGRALYTSSILIGALWISVIFLIMLGYFLLYHSSRLAVDQRPWGLWGGIALVVFLGVSRIYSMNMTLMLRPDVWADMYSRTATGLPSVPPDPTLMSRWLFLLACGVGFGSLGTALYGLKRTLAESTRFFLVRRAAVTSLIGLVMALGIGFWAFQTQPEVVRTSVMSVAWYQGAGYAWLVGSGLAIFTAIWLWVRPQTIGRGKVLLTLLSGLISLGSVVLLRDGVRDFTLGTHGFDVWQRQVATNWMVVTLFLVLFVLGIGLLAWLGWVVNRARPMEETYVKA